MPSDELMASMRLGHRLALASVSPRRRALLREAGYDFEAFDPGEAEEQITDAGSPEELAMAKARAKAKAVGEAQTWKYPTVVIGADTIAARNGEILGKPTDRVDAYKMLGKLSGTRHQVLTGLCLWPSTDGHEPETMVESSWVTMRRMTDAEISAYVDSGEADGKAGAYAIQETGDRFVTKVEGSIKNVIGFPLERFEQFLSECFEKWKWVR